MPSLPTLQPLDLYRRTLACLGPGGFLPGRRRLRADDARTSIEQRSNAVSQVLLGKDQLRALAEGAGGPQLCGRTERGTPTACSAAWCRPMAGACMRNAARWTTSTRHALQRDLPRSGRRARAPAGVPQPGRASGAVHQRARHRMQRRQHVLPQRRRPAHHPRPISTPSPAARTRAPERIETGKAAGHSVMNRRRRYTGSNPSPRRVLARALGVALVAVFTAGLAATRRPADPARLCRPQPATDRPFHQLYRRGRWSSAMPAPPRSPLALIASSEEGLQRHRSRPPGTDPRQLASGKHRAAAPAGTATGALAAQRADRTTDPARRPEDRFGGDRAWRAARCASCSPVSPAWSCACCLPPWAPFYLSRRLVRGTSSARPTGEGRAYRAPRTISRSAYRKPASPS